ncbi:right-handed parallel beta-helix repeat-containing protein [Pelagicoccus sp. SDUM812005]|uniref:right-handed parallel beta-helix repeat-containing protein n=1 Tax=Pelagicoccus sp. SDUM812005 TaxID=3041257 RepID=UPI00280E7D56|nr:right-handed parallel beta-helix repeat-containing protein [Pelagicoccus sp. SDUM812005]MDQ8183473.1 right-handed parallel beta-helix repeat-containing protein [Pelagicoccus sp. SDUM812005]
MNFFSNTVPKILAAALLSSVLYGCGAKSIYYVAPQGNDQNPGTEDSPFASLAGARDFLRQSGELGDKPIEVIVRPGVYYLPETLRFEAKDSGSEGNEVVYRAEIEGESILSGGSRLELKWRPYRDGIYQAITPEGLAIDQLFIDGKSQRMARYPNYDPSKKAQAYQGFAADAFSKERAARWEDPEGGYIHAMHISRWGGYHYRITGKDDEGNVTFEGGWQNNRQMGMHEEYRMVENIFEELDAEGEWFHNQKTNTLYYKPIAGERLEEAKVEVVRLRHLVEFQGSESQPVRHITLKGFVARHAARTFMDTKEPLLRSDWAIYRGGAFKLSGTEDVSILDCEFDQVGGNAIFVNEYNRDTLVRGCHIHDVGASGVCFVGDPDAVRDPLFEYAEVNDLSKIDRTVGPKTNNYPSGGIVEDCLIHGIGTVERQPAGVQISMAMGITVRDTSIYDTARAGINISDGTWGGHLIERCDVFDTVLETHDHGSFNSWGRDRFWRNDHLTATQAAVDEDPDLPFLDAMKTTVIRNSRWRCDHGWDIDLDDGSSNYDIYNNLMLRGGLKFREGFRRRAWNNIAVNNGFHPHVWFRNSGDEVFSNIFMIPHQEIRVGFGGKRVDGNIFHSNDPSITEYDEAWNWENNALVAELEFVDPANGDFRLKDGSPAFDYGFENFPMDQFGVKKPSLKAIARTPDIPPLNMVSVEDGEEAVDAFWQGGRIHSLDGEEFSAYGVSKEDGGIAILDAPAGSGLATNGLVAGDLIQKVNGHPVSTLPDFFAALDRLGDGSLELLVIRNQQAKVVAFER